MIEATINKILKSLNNLPKEYKNALYRILISLVDGVKALDELKVDKEDGKELSSNDFTDELKNKLDGIEDGAQKNVKSDWNATEGDALILNKPTFTEYPNAAEWDHINHKIIFKHNDTELPDMEIDGADFVKDGMIENIEIVNGYLVITFNTDHGREPISIPLSDIFNPENYYTKEDINHKFYTKEQSNNKYVEKVPGKQLSTEDFTTAFKKKLENLGGSDTLILHYECHSNGNNGAGSTRENIINNQKLINDFIAAGGDSNKIIALLKFTVETFDLLRKESYPYPIGSAIGINFKQRTMDKRINYVFDIISFNSVCYNPDHRTERLIRYGGFIGKFCIEYYDNRYIDAFTFNYVPREELVTLTTVNKLLGNITSYTNEEIEQLIAQGYDVKVFKLNIDEDKTLLQQILVDNPEDGSIDITQALYFVYDSSKDKYYDVNSLIIDTVEEDRQINIVGGLGRLDYTAIKINTNDAEYIVNPSHVESTNADWNENDEDKASYVKNRTHWKESGEILDNIIKIYDSIEHTNEHLIAEYTPIEFREVFAQIIYNKINNIQIFEDIVFPVGYFKPFGANWQNYNLYSCIIHFNDVKSDGLTISVKYVENSEEVNEEYLIDNTLSAIAIKQQLENTMFTSNNWNDNYGIIALYRADIEECICKKVITDIIHPLDSKYLEDLTDEEINEILE